jgi:hypothetical protein
VRLAEGWTPEQISGWLKSGNEPRLRAIGCETIYAFTYRTAQKAEALWRYLTRRHKRRRPRRVRASRDTIKDRVSIHDRPKTIERRGEAGHWEGDLIICKCTRPVLVFHERKSRVTLAARLTGKTAAETISAMLAVFGRIDPHLRRSITFDNDTAFAQHGLLRTMRDMTTWFCDAYASWQKGGIENANGRLRRWLPRHLDIDCTSDQEIQEIVLTTNLTPPFASGSRHHCKPCLPSLERTFKFASLLSALRFAPESRGARSNGVFCRLIISCRTSSGEAPARRSFVLRDIDRRGLRSRSGMPYLFVENLAIQAPQPLTKRKAHQCGVLSWCPDTGESPSESHGSHDRHPRSSCLSGRRLGPTSTFRNLACRDRD